MLKLITGDRGNTMDDKRITLSIDPDTLPDDEVRIIGFGVDATGQFRVYHLDLDNLAWMLARHQEGKKVVIEKGGMQAVVKEPARGE